MEKQPMGTGNSLAVIGIGVTVIGLTALTLPPASRAVVLGAGALLIAVGVVELVRSRRAKSADGAPTGDITVGGSVSGEAVAIGHQATASVNQAKKPTLIEVAKMDSPEPFEGRFRVVHEARVVVHSFSPGLLTVVAKNPKLVSLNVEGLDRPAGMQMIGNGEGEAIVETPNPLGRYRITVVTSDASDSLVLCYLDHDFALGWHPA